MGNSNGLRIADCGLRIRRRLKLGPAGQRLPRRSAIRNPQSAITLLVFLALLICTPLSVGAAVGRLVVVKVDGLPFATVDRFVRERDPRTGKSLLPWFEHVFYERGARLENFYVRGTSLSGPSWSLLDTGQHLQIKGNVEFDRYTLHSYDYLSSALREEQRIAPDDAKAISALGQ